MVTEGAWTAGIWILAMILDWSGTAASTGRAPARASRRGDRGAAALDTTTCLALKARVGSTGATTAWAGLEAIMAASVMENIDQG